VFFFWSTTQNGKIWLDSDGIKQLINKELPKDSSLQEISFLGEKNLLSIHISKPASDLIDLRSNFEKKISDIFISSGIDVQINWLDISPQDNPHLTPIWELPIFWGALLAALTALVNLGIKGIIMSFIALIIGYATSWLLLTSDGQKYLSKIKQRIWG